MVSALVSSTWLKQQLTNGLKNIRILDASWFLDSTRNAREEYKRERINDAAFFDIDEVSEQSSEYSHMLPTTEQFERQVGQLGVGNQHHVVIYDNNEQYGFFSAPRVWWMFRVFGHEEVSVVDGGLPRWKFRGYPVSHGSPPVINPQSYRAGYNESLVRSFKEMIKNHNTKTEQVVDARSEGRFNGVSPEPRPSLPSGHMTGSINVPFYSLINPTSKILKSKHELQEEFEKAGVDLDKPLVASCGSGVTATIVAFAAYMLNKEIPVYDGSWTEWTQRAPQDTMKLGVKGQDK